MESSVISPEAGARPLTPAEVKARYFEFFPAGTHKEALLLGEVVEQFVHRVRSKGHNVLCGARTGVCPLCDKAAESDDICAMRVEYYAPAFVRGLRDREYVQKVAVFSAGALEQLLKILGEGAYRGQRLDVTGISRGSSTRYLLKGLPGLPSGFPSMIPATYDVVPFVRARYGKPADPLRPMVFLPPFKCELSVSGSGGRPRPMALSAEDFRPDPQDVANMKAMLERMKLEEPTPAPVAQPKPTPKPSVTPSPEKASRAIQARLAQAHTEDDARLREIRKKPPEDLTPGQAVEAGRIFDYVLNGPAPSNGHAKKGGAQ